MADLFEQINQVWESSDQITTKTKPESAYMTSRFISLSEFGFFGALHLNRKGSLPEWASLPYLKFMTPKRNTPRNTYPKKVTEGALSVKDRKALGRICAKFNVTERHGKEIKMLLEAQGFKFPEN